MHIYVIRHGESLGNIGQTEVANCDLSDRGKIQAERLVPFFEKIALTRIYSSPFKRTIQTALPLAGNKGLPIILVPDMREIFNQAWANLWEYDWEDCAEIESMFPGTKFIESHDKARQWWPAEAEEADHVQERTGRFLRQELLPLAGGNERVAVFGHGASTNQLRRQICPDAAFPKIDFNTNAVIYEYRLDDRGECVEYNIHYQHIADCLSPLKARDH
ncbi:MAG: phosphoglycerate mutase [Paenibacillaceae bacterium]|nr:phosphoglycerate mutase [Paenibacillaceae bacterium]